LSFVSHFATGSLVKIMMRVPTTPPRKGPVLIYPTCDGPKFQGGPENRAVATMAVVTYQVIYHRADFAGTSIWKVLCPTCRVFDFVIPEAEEASSWSGPSRGEGILDGFKHFGRVFGRFLGFERFER
jgi:hypothetical protein